MTANDDLSRRLSDHYVATAPTRAPDWVLEDALAIVGTTPQRRGVNRAPWGGVAAKRVASLAAAAVVVLAIGGIGIMILRPGVTPGPGTKPSASPSAEPSPSPNPTPSASPPPALTESFTSTIHGISVSFPAGWVPKPATEPWTSGIPHQDEPFVDTIDIAPSGSPFIALVSHAPSGADWIADVLIRAPRTERACPDREPIEIDGNPGVLAPDCFDGVVAFVTVQDRGYFIWLYGEDDLAWFKEIVATVRLHPEDAVGAAPSDSP